MTPVLAVVTDIEGTTSPIAFVREVLFPYARNALPAFIVTHHQQPEVAEWLSRIALETGVSAEDLDALVGTLQSWIDSDKKHTALKALQGLIWVDGYRNADFKAPVYEDAHTRLLQWKAQGLPLYVYSSGSVPAQKLFFAFTDHGDMTPCFSGYFDTETGAKQDPRSYQAIAEAIGKPGDSILFLSDIVAELDAARTAGWQTCLIDRQEDYPTARLADACNGHRRATRFTEIDV
jgi:enolase-phosphatase E1